MNVIQQSRGNKIIQQNFSNYGHTHDLILLLTETNYLSKNLIPTT